VKLLDQHEHAQVDNEYPHGDAEDQANVHRSAAAGLLALFDQFPKALLLAELIVLGHGQFCAEEEIAQRILVQHTVHGNAFLAPVEVDAVVLCPIAEQPLPIALQDAKFLLVQLVEVFRQELEFGQQVELEVLGQRGHFGGADFIEDDLEHSGRRLG
jgi:hypothetical protein